MLAVELTRLGDVVAAVNAVRRVRQAIPDGSLHIMVDDRYAALLRDLDLDATVHGVSESATLRGLVRAIGLARRLKADTALSMSPAKRNASVVLASGAPTKVGYLSYTESHTPFLSDTPVEIFGVEPRRRIIYRKENIELRPMHVFQALGLEPSPHEGSLPLRHSKGVPSSSAYIVIHPFAAWRFREWSLGNFASLAQSIVLETGMDIVFICSEDEKRALEVLKTTFRSEPRIRFFASGNLTESASLMKGAIAFIGNDSGPLHLAASLGVPVIGLFGPADPLLTGPRNSRAICLYHQVECSPCPQTRCVRPDDPCIDLIQPSEVLSALRKVISPASVKEVAPHG
jgi:ADP-heptose:LPS heptosyltransferase